MVRRREDGIDERGKINNLIVLGIGQRYRVINHQHLLPKRKCEYENAEERKKGVRYI